MFLVTILSILLGLAILAVVGYLAWSIYLVINYYFSRKRWALWVALPGILILVSMIAFIAGLGGVVLAVALG